MRRAPAAVAALVLCGAARAEPLPATAPLPPSPSAPAPSPPPPADADAMPPYEGQLERLAERLGTLALLRELCGDGDASEFRSRMAALIDTEGRTAPRRDRLAGAFNRGFRGYAATYRRCTPSARLAISRTLAEADRTAHDLSARYGGD